MAAVTKLKTKRPLPAEPETPLEDVVWGAFAGDPVFLEAMKLGRKYRESLRPKAKAKAKRKSSNARPRH